MTCQALFPGRRLQAGERAVTREGIPAITAVAIPIPLMAHFIQVLLSIRGS